MAETKLNKAISPEDKKKYWGSEQFGGATVYPSGDQVKVGEFDKLIRESGGTPGQQPNLGIKPPNMKRGGPVRVSGLYRLHKGEQVMPKSLAARYRETRRG
jgi:hypothetical protein